LYTEKFNDTRQPQNFVFRVFYIIICHNFNRNFLTPPQTRWDSYSAPPDPLARFRGLILRKVVRRMDEKGKE